MRIELVVVLERDVGEDRARYVELPVHVAANVVAGPTEYRVELEDAGELDLDRKELGQVQDALISEYERLERAGGAEVAL